MTKFGALLTAALSLTAPDASHPQEPTPANPFAQCQTSSEVEPGNRRSAECFFEVAKRGGLWDEAARRLNACRVSDRDNPWLPFYLGHVQLYRGLKEAETLYREAVSLAGKRREPAAEIEARIALTRYLSRLGRLEEAGEMLSLAVRRAEELADPIILAKVRIRQAWQCYYEGRRLDHAYNLLRQVERHVFRQGPVDLRMQWLDATAIVSFALGRNDIYLQCKEHLRTIAKENGDLATVASASFDIANQHYATELPSPTSRQRVRSLFEAALAAAAAAQHPSIMGQAHRELGKLAGGETGRRHLETCLDIARNLDDLKLSVLCRGALATNRLEEDPREAQALIERAMADAGESADPWISIYLWEERLQVHWATLPRHEAVARSLEVLDAIEILRELQGPGTGRAGLLSAQAGAYYWLSGWLLSDAQRADRQQAEGREDLELAAHVTERLRARVLLETLEAADAAAPSSTAAPLIHELAEILGSKVEIQRQLLDPRLDPSSRAEAVSELRILEAREAGIRDSMARTSPSDASLRQPTLATLDQIEDRLGDDEALLSFLFGFDEDFSGRFAGGSWLLVSNRGASRSYRLPDRVTVEPALDVLLGLTTLEDGAKALERLYRDLLRQALDDLPPGVERLVIIPDGELHRLPPALLPSLDGTPLIARFELSVVPSATLWLRWRDLEPPTSEVPVLALADPALAGRDPENDVPLAPLGPLPYAREEGQTVVRTLGGKSRLLLGVEATERFLKEHDLGRYGILHFAAHTLINEEVPERSAVLLAPGATNEDGWLQPREIVDLDLDGRVVVLASCESAAGRLLRGEGVMSLARAFFQAGAPVVVAGLWPLPDDSTAAIFKKFYRHLAAGKSVAGALAEAQREMIRKGTPARDWAGLVALGNGDLVPFPGGLERPPCRWWLAGVLLLAMLAAGIVRYLRRRPAS